MDPCQITWEAICVYDSYNFYEYHKIMIRHNSLVINNDMHKKIWTRMMNRIFEIEMGYGIIHNGVVQKVNFLDKKFHKW